MGRYDHGVQRFLSCAILGSIPRSIALSALKIGGSHLYTLAPCIPPPPPGPLVLTAEKFQKAAETTPRLVWTRALLGHKSTMVVTLQNHCGIHTPPPGRGGATTTGPDAIPPPPPTICQNLRGGGGGASAGGWGCIGSSVGAGLCATHYYHMHTSRGGGGLSGGMGV